MHASSIHAFLFSGLVSLTTISIAAAQTATRPPIGDYGSPADAMIFSVARGAKDACGPGCADWIPAEGTVEYDTHKRLLAVLDREAGRKLPIVIYSRGRSNFNVAASMGRILRER